MRKRGKRETQRDREKEAEPQRETHTETWTEANDADKPSGQTDSTAREINYLGPPGSTPEET